MEFLNVGLGELVTIMVIALLVFGPERLPEVARRTARFFNEVRKMAGDVQRTFLDETQDIRDPIEAMKRDIATVKQPLQELKRESEAARDDVLNTTQAAVNEVKSSTATTNGNSGEGSHPYKPLSSGEPGNN